MRRDSSMTSSRLQRIHREDGVSLIQVAISILVLVMLESRRMCLTPSIASVSVSPGRR